MAVPTSATAAVAAALNEASFKEQQILALKEQVNSLDGANVRLSKDLGAAQKALAELGDVVAQNAALKSDRDAQKAQIANLEASLVAAKAKLDKADAVIAAGKAVKAGLALLG